MWEVSDPAACPDLSPHCRSLQKLSCSFTGCSSSSLPPSQERVVHAGRTERFITGATVTASCSHDVDQYTVLETWSDPGLVMSVTSPQYRPQYPAPSPWCLHHDCQPVRGVPWLADNNLAGPDCLEEKPGAAWCLGDPSVLHWQDGHFRISNQSYEKRKYLSLR